MSLTFVAIGDSKTGSVDCCGYQDDLLASLQATENWPVVSGLPSFATGGQTTASARTGIDAYLATFSDPAIKPDWVLVNLGSNDFPAMLAGSLNQAGWEADMGYIIDALHTKWPAAQIGLARPIYLGYETQFDLYADTWIPGALASRSGFTFLGPDERSYLPGHMDDDTHPDESGYVLTAAAWQTAMGY